MKKTLSGVCIGGPWAGRYVEKDAPLFSVVEVHPLPERFRDLGDETALGESVAISRAIYSYGPIWTNGGTIEIGLWRVDHLTDTEAIRALIAGYAEHHTKGQETR